MRTYQVNTIRKRILFTLLAAFLCIPAFTYATEKNANPGINRPYKNAQFSDWINRFERPGREVYDKRHEVVKLLQLKQGMDIADVGAGTGFYSLLFAEQVGKNGKVYAVDIAKDFVHNIVRRARKKGLDNVYGIINNEKSVNLPAHSVDMVFICDTYHHFEYPQTILSSIRQALRPNGQLVIIDFRKQAGQSSDWIMSHVRANKPTVIKEVEKAGFQFSGESAILKSNYFLSFTKTH